MLQVLDTKELTLESSKMHADLINMKCLVMNTKLIAEVC